MLKLLSTSPFSPLMSLYLLLNRLLWDMFCDRNPGIRIFPLPFPFLPFLFLFPPPLPPSPPPFSTMGIFGKWADNLANHITISCLYSVFTYLGTLKQSVRAKTKFDSILQSRFNASLPSHKNSNHLKAEIAHFHHRHPHISDSVVQQALLSWRPLLKMLVPLILGQLPTPTTRMQQHRFSNSLTATHKLQIR